MGCVPSALLGEIVAIELLRHNDFKTDAHTYLQDGGLKSHSKMPAAINQNWERAKPGFKSLLQEALDIRNANRGIWGTSTKLEKLLGQERAPSDPTGTGAAVAGGWVERARSALAENGLELCLHAKNGDQGHCLIAIIDPASPEAKVGCHRGTGCCGC